MDIRNFINLKSDELIKLSNDLKSVTTEWQVPIIIDCSNISQQNIPALLAKHPNLVAGRKYPGIYYFKILNDKIDNNNVIEALKHYKKLRERLCPKIENKRSKDSKFLYCGSKRVDLFSRFLQHLGLGHKYTYSLQLLHWAKDLGLLIEFNYCFLEKEQMHLTELIEASLTMAIKPLVGKLVK
ncbi:MAG: hypothetical protein FD166_2096 [Bacteroidetes bacterium]|nr:MAG: hypothetical protein FD166_2096 [Bacteroidota bacterium]